MALLITCPSCSQSSEVPESAAGRDAMLTCPRCSRRIAVRDAQAVRLGGRDETVPYDPGTAAVIEVDDSGGPGGAARLALPRGRRISLDILSGPREGEVVVLTHPRLVIGREGGGPDVDLAFDDAQVSRSHAALECYGARVVLVDLDSRNGTFVGDESIQRHDLQDRTEFRVGGTRLRLRFADRR